METGRPGHVRVVHLDHRQIQTLAHPLRVRLLGELRADGPATATMLAGRLASNTGATSYHLRRLAEVGLVIEEPDQAAGRQRWWRAAHEMSSWRPTDFDDDPDASAASDWIQSQALRLLIDEAERWFSTRREHTAAWREAAGFSDYLLRLTPQRLRAMVDELAAVIERYQAEPDTGQDAQQVVMALAGFPRVAQR